MAIVIEQKRTNGRPTFDDIEAVARQNGIALVGGKEGATFSSFGVKGLIVVSDESVTINITEKPFLLSESMIRSEIHRRFALL